MPNFESAHIPMRLYDMAATSLVNLGNADEQEATSEEFETARVSKQTPFT